MFKKDENILTSQYNSTDLMVGKTIRWTPDLQITYALVEREAFKWFRGEEEIVGENSDSYELTEADLGHDISLQISIINDEVPSTYTAVLVEVPFIASDQSNSAGAAALTADNYNNSISQKLIFDLYGHILFVVTISISILIGYSVDNFIISIYGISITSSLLYFFYLIKSAQFSRGVDV